MMKSTARRSPLKSARRPLTFAEQREKERIVEASTMGPGAHDTLVPMGADKK